MHSVKNYFYFLLFGILFASCGGDKKTVSTVSSADSSSMVKPAVAVNTDTTGSSQSAVASDAVFVFKITGEDAGQPKSTVSLKAAGKTTLINTIDGPAEKIAREDYSSKKIPAGAADACGAFWAEEGNYYYVLPAGKGFKVFEAQNDGGSNYPWTLVKEIN